MERYDFIKFFSRGHWRRMLPEGFSTSIPRIIFKLPLTLGRIMFNYSNLSVHVEESQTLMLCRCNDPEFIHFKDNKFKHVITTNLDIIKDIHLRNLMKLGTKFRPANEEWSKDKIFKELQGSFYKWVSDSCHKAKLDRRMFEQWRIDCLDNIKRELIPKISCEETQYTWTKQDKNELKDYNSSLSLHTWTKLQLTLR